MILRAPLALLVCALATPAFAGSKTTGGVSLKGGERPVAKRAAKAPLGHVLMRHLDMAVAIDAQSRGLEAQAGAVSSRYATTRSISPGSRLSNTSSGCRFPSPAWKTLSTCRSRSDAIAYTPSRTSGKARRGTTVS